MIELGATDPTRDFVYVGDTVNGIMSAGSAAEGVEGEVINLGTGVEVSIGDLAARILRLLEREVPVTLDEKRLRPPDSEVERLVADPGKARTLLGWEPGVELDEGLKRTIEWLTESIGSYKPSIYNV